MLVYEGLKSDFRNAVKNQTIASEIEQTIFKKLGRRTQQSELNSWINSLTFMSEALDDDSIPSDAGIAIEYNIPLSAKRVVLRISCPENSGHYQWARNFF